MALQTYRDLAVWQRAMDLVVEIYKVSKLWPKEELYGLTSQIRRAATSVPSNIAEGYGRTHRKAYLNHLSIARGSLLEAETQLQIAIRLEYLKREEALPAWNLMQETGRLLHGLTRSLSDKGQSDAPSEP